MDYHVLENLGIKCATELYGFGQDIFKCECFIAAMPNYACNFSCKIKCMCNVQINKRKNPF